MRYRRVVIAGALVLTMAGAAAAQSNDLSGAAPAKPISLLQILQQPASSQPAQDDAATATAQAPADPAAAQPERRTRVAHKHHAVRKFAHRKTHDEDTAAAPQSPASDQAAADTAPAPDTAANAQTPPDRSNVSAMVIDGHTVQVAAPDQVNMLDMATGYTQTPPAPSQQAQATVAPPQAAAADPQQTAVADPQSATAATLQQAAVLPAPAEQQPEATDQQPEAVQSVATASEVQQDNGSDRSRDLWYEKLLATLSGAFVAASVAWLVIGSAPPRRDRREPMLTYDTERMTR